MVKLSQRLAAIASFAEESKAVVDVGTDHGHIPVWLAQKGNTQRITASDVKQGPLESAKNYAEEHDVFDKIDFALTDGLSGLDETYDTVIIAGMGGETIISILEAAPWTKNGTKLVLQPQSKIELLNYWLCDNGYKIDDGALVKDAGKLYAVLCVSGGEMKLNSEISAYVNDIFIEKRDPLTVQYISELIRKNEHFIAGMEKGGHTSQKEYYDAKMLEDKLTALMKEAEKW